MLPIKILLFLMVNIAGFFTNALLVNLALMLDKYPRMPTQASLDSFNTWLYTGSFWVWLAAALLSVGYFIAERNRGWFILAPLYLPALYTIGVLTYFLYTPVPV